jgi:hypothetical protein
MQFVFGAIAVIVGLMLVLVVIVYVVLPLFLIGVVIALVAGLFAELAAGCAVLTRSVPTGIGPFEIAPPTVEPEDVRRGTSLPVRRPSRSENDFAWAFYLRGQYAADMQAVMESANVLSSHAVRYFSRRWLGWNLKSPLLIFGIGLALAFSAAAVLTAGLMIAVTLPVFAIVVVGRWLLLRTVRIGQAVHRSRTGVLAQCMQSGCYYATAKPDFLCPNPDCTAVHRDLDDARLGVIARRCGCGAAMTARTTAAARSDAYTAQCPRCEHALESGAGASRGLLVAVVGAPQSGKTSIVARGLRGTLAAMRGAGRDYQLLNPIAEGYATGQTYLHGSGLPSPVPIEIDPGHRTPTVLHILDPAGSHFGTLEQVAELTYLSRADGILVVLRGLDLLGISDDGRAQQASIDNTLGYEQMVSRLVNSGVATKRKPIAIAITGYDQLLREGKVRMQDAANSDSVRSWMEGHQLDSIVKQTELEFAEVGYFLVDAAGPIGSSKPVHPGVVVRWIADQAGIALPDPSQTQVPAPQSESAESVR